MPYLETAVGTLFGSLCFVYVVLHGNRERCAAESIEPVHGNAQGGRRVYAKAEAGCYRLLVDIDLVSH
jgi:hypothetical protein